MSDSKNAPSDGEHYAAPYIAKGWAVFPVERNKKPKTLIIDGKPHPMKWKEKALPVPITEFAPQHNVGLRLDCHIEIDPDGDNSHVLVAQYFKSTPTMQWGRTSRPGKLLFENRVPGAAGKYNGFYYVGDRLVKTLEAQSGQDSYTILPGGTHESGEVIARENDLAPAVHDLSVAINYCKTINLMLMLVAHWQSVPSRDELTCAITRVLIDHCGRTPEAAAQICAFVANAVGDEDGPEERANKARHAAQSTENDKKMYGVPQLKKILGERNVDKLLEDFGSEQEEPDTDEFKDPLINPSRAPEFPLHLFPKILRDVAADAAERQDRPAAMVAMPMLTALETALGNQVRTRVRHNDDTYILTLPLYVLVADRIHGGKSPMMKIALAPLKLLEKVYVAEFDDRFAEWETDMARWETSKDPNKGPKPEKPSRSILTRTRFSSGSAMLQALHDDPNGFLCHFDEYRGWLNRMGKQHESGGGDEEAILNATYNGGSAHDETVDEKRRRHVHEGMIGICAGTQLDLVYEAALGSLGKSGYFQRHIIVVVNTKLVRSPLDRVEDKAALKAYDGLLRCLVDTFRMFPWHATSGGKCFFKLSKKAADQYRAWERWAEHKATQNRDLASHYSKLIDVVPRIATALHACDLYAAGHKRAVSIVGNDQFVDRKECVVLDLWNDKERCDLRTDRLEIPVDTLNKAIQLVRDFVFPCLGLVYEHIAAGPVERWASAVREVLLKWPPRGGSAFSDTGISGFGAGRQRDRRDEIHEEAKTEPLGGVQGTRGLGSDPG